MAQLNIYADCTAETPTKTYTCRRVLASVIQKLTKFVDSMDGKTNAEQLAMLGDFAKLIFPDLTDEEIGGIDIIELQEFFKEILQMAKGNIGQAQKN